jgi:hypothetical protein
MKTCQLPLQYNGILYQDDAYPSKFQPSCGVGRPPVRTAVFQTLTPQPGTVLPGTLATLFARPGWSRWRRSLGGGPVAAYLLTRNVLWRDFICTEICGRYAKKSFKWFYNSAPQVEQYYLQLFTSLARVYIKYTSSHDFAAISKVQYGICDSDDWL